MSDRVMSVMSNGIVSEDYTALEAILIEYVERYGLTPSARQFFEAQGAKAKQEVIDLRPVFARRSA